VLGDIGRLLGRSLFLGSFVPAFFFCLGNGIALWIKGLALGLGLAAIVDWPTAILIVLATAAFLAMLLRGINIVILRVFEGYPLHRFRRFVQKPNSKRANLYKKIRELEGKQQESEGLTPAEEGQLTLLWHEAETKYPPEGREILPTLLGNVIRAFEYYPSLRYSMEGVTIWTRLLTVIPKEHVETIEDAKARVDFLLNSTVLLLLSGTGWGAWFLYGNHWCAGLACIFFTFLVSYGLYRASIVSALEWGTEVRNAYDVYRRDLLKKLGLAEPTTDAEERAVWDKLSWFFMYSEYSKREGFPYGKS